MPSVTVALTGKVNVPTANSWFDAGEVTVVIGGLLSTTDHDSTNGPVIGLTLSL